MPVTAIIKVRIYDADKLRWYHVYFASFDLIKGRIFIKTVCGCFNNRECNAQRRLALHSLRWSRYSLAYIILF